MLPRANRPRLASYSNSRKVTGRARKPDEAMHSDWLNLETLGRPKLVITSKKPLLAVASALAWLLATDARPQDGIPRDPRESAQIFFTGHSLIDNPLPDWVELIAKSKGNKIAWEQQNIPGAPLRL